MSTPKLPLPPVVETYLRGVDADRAPTVLALDALVRSANPDLDVAVKYNLLMYTVGGDWRHWVVAVDAHPKHGVGLRFLYGVILDDPLGVLRAGTSVLKTWDFAPGAAIDEAAVQAYVTEAVARHEHYRANSPAIIEASRAAARGRPATKARG